MMQVESHIYETSRTLILVAFDMEETALREARLS
jgi:hypothetical protein